MIILKPGNVIHVYCVYIDPPHFKYVICVCPKFPLFFFVNSEPRKSTPDAQVLIKKSELPLLPHDSYVNTATMYTFNEIHLKRATVVSSLSKDIKKKIKSAVREHTYLPKRHADLVLSNL